MVKFLLWCILFVLCWPLALLALVAFPFIWLAAAALPAAGDCGGRGAGAGDGDYFPAGAGAACDLRRCSSISVCDP